MALIKLTKKSRELMLLALNEQRTKLISQAGLNTMPDIKIYYKEAVTANMEAAEALEQCKNESISITFQ